MTRVALALIAALAAAGCVSRPSAPREEVPAPVQAAPVERVQQGGLAPPPGVGAAAPR